MSEDGGHLWAWQELGEDGRWGVVMVLHPALGNVVLVHRDESIARGQMKPFAEIHARTTGRRVRLARYELAHVEDGVIPVGSTPRL
jgi:hypothetical protein